MCQDEFASQRDCFRNGIEAQHTSLLQFLSQNYEKISSCKSLKYVAGYAIVMFDTGLDIAVLLRGERYTSIEHICRGLVECYSILKNLLQTYSTPAAFDDYVKNLVILDLAQDKTTNDRIQKDASHPTPAMVSQSFVDRFNHLVSQHFPSETVDPSREIESLLEIIKRQKKSYDGQYPFNHDEAGFVDWALKNNSVWTQENNGKPYPGSLSVYGELCRFSHSNISAIDERVVKAGEFVMNAYTKNTLAALSLVYACLKDINDTLRILIP